MAADELSECVQDFYHNLSERLQTQFKGTADLQNPQQTLNVMDIYYMLSMSFFYFF